MKASRIPPALGPENMWVPDPTASDPKDRYQSRSKSKPWDYDCEVSLPHFESLDTLPVIIALLRAQSINAYIVIIDTGSSVATMAKLEELRADDLEIHYLRMGGVRHISDLPAAACDLAFAIARNEIVVTMHTDVFLRRKTSLEELIDHLDLSAAAGLRMTPRPREEWKTSISHSFAAFRMSAMDKLGASWSLRRACRITGATHSNEGTFGSALDTETCISEVLRAKGVLPYFIGDEENFQTTIHPLVRHVRTLTGTRLYCQDKRERAERDLKEAMEEAEANLKEWGANG